jgi:hypothetical protein
MAQMVRKQFYISRRQEQQLKRLAQERGVSEAELVRQAIDRQLGPVFGEVRPDADAWAEARDFMLSLGDRPLEGIEPLHWDRDDLYEGRFTEDDGCSG